MPERNPVIRKKPVRTPNSPIQPRLSDVTSRCMGLARDSSTRGLLLENLRSPVPDSLRTNNPVVQQEPHIESGSTGYPPACLVDAKWTARPNRPNFPSWSWIRNFGRPSEHPLRICCFVQSSVGCSVTLKWTTLRPASSMTTET